MPNSISAEVQSQTGQRTVVRYLIQPIIDSLRRSWCVD